MQKGRQKASEEVMENHTARFEGSDKLFCNNVEYKGTDAVGKLCRVLKTGNLTIFRNGRVSRTVNVEKRALKSLHDNDMGLGYHKYTPFCLQRVIA